MLAILAGTCCLLAVISAVLLTLFSQGKPDVAGTGPLGLHDAAFWTPVVVLTVSLCTTIALAARLLTAKPPPKPPTVESPHPDSFTRALSPVEGDMAREHDGREVKEEDEFEDDLRALADGSSSEEEADVPPKDVAQEAKPEPKPAPHPATQRVPNPAPHPATHLDPKPDPKGATPAATPLKTVPSMDVRPAGVRTPVAARSRHRHPDLTTVPSPALPSLHGVSSRPVLISTPVLPRPSVRVLGGHPAHEPMRPRDAAVTSARPWDAPAAVGTSSMVGRPARGPPPKLPASPPMVQQVRPMTSPYPSSPPFYPQSELMLSLVESPRELSPGLDEHRRSALGQALREEQDRCEALRAEIAVLEAQQRARSPSPFDLHSPPRDWSASVEYL